MSNDLSGLPGMPILASLTTEVPGAGPAAAPADTLVNAKAMNASAALRRRKRADMYHLPFRPVRKSGRPDTEQCAGAQFPMQTPAASRVLRRELCEDLNMAAEE